jgi:hypothetical protein
MSAPTEQTPEQAQPLAEADAMRQVAEALAPLNDDSRRRVLAWATETHGCPMPTRRIRPRNPPSIPGRIIAARANLPEAFRVCDITDLGISTPDPVRSTMHRMADEGTLRRVGRGLFSFSEGGS